MASTLKFNSFLELTKPCVNAHKSLKCFQAWTSICCKFKCHIILYDSHRRRFEWLR